MTKPKVALLINNGLVEQIVSDIDIDVVVLDADTDGGAHERIVFSKVTAEYMYVTDGPVEVNPELAEEMVKDARSDPYFVGTVCKGSFRLQDILPAFMEKLHCFHEGMYTKLTQKYEPEGFIPRDAEGEDGHIWWESVQAIERRIEIEDVLNSLAPEGFYFGSHPGNDSDFGYWRRHDSE